MNYSVAIKEPGRGYVGETINGKKASVLWHILEWEAGIPYYEFRIKIRNWYDFKIKGSWDAEKHCFGIFDPIMKKIKHYYDSIDGAKWRSFTNDVFLDNDASSTILNFRIFDGNFAFADEIIDEYLKCFA
jgi:hypothetical protein